MGNVGEMLKYSFYIKVAETKIGKKDCVHITSEMWYFCQGSCPPEAENKYYHAKMLWFSEKLYQLLQLIFLKLKFIKKHSLQGKKTPENACVVFGIRMISGSNYSWYKH